jgi:anti-anti-sigma factor
MPIEPVTFQVYQTGELSVVGFGSATVLDRLDLGRCRDELAAFIRDHGCKFLAFDLTGIKVFPSGMLGLLASLRKMGVEVHLYNPSEDVSEVLEITGLVRFMHLHQVDVG